MALVILLIMLSFVLSTVYFGKYFSNKKTDTVQVEDIRLALDELKNIHKMKFEIVPAKVIYPKTIGFVLKGLGIIMSCIFVASFLDIITMSTHHTPNPWHYFSFIGLYLFVLIIVYIGPFSSMAWDYHYYKYGLARKLKHADIVDAFIKNYLKKFIKYYIIAVLIGYFIAKLCLGAGLLGVAIASIITLLIIDIFIAIEEKRIGFAPIFNLFTEKLNELKGKQNG